MHPIALNSRILWLVCFLWPLGTALNTGFIKCPPDRILYPCKCHPVGQIECTEPMAYSVGHIFKAIRRSLGTSLSHNGPHYSQLILSNKYVDTLDDNQFHSIRFEKITLTDMILLSRIKSNAFNGTQNYVRSFSIKGENKLDIQFMNQLFDALSSLVNVREMHLELNNLQIIPSYAFRDLQPEQVQRIRLERLRIISRSLTQIPSYAFYELRSLRFIKIQSATGLQRISAHAFDIVQPSSTHQLKIDLRFNQLTEASFELDAFSRVNRPVLLQLAHNNLTTLQREVFERFLNLDQQNVLEVTDNPLECDCSVDWLLRDRPTYISQIRGAVCEEFADLWSLDETAFLQCNHDDQYMPRLIFRNSAAAILFFAHSLVAYSLLLQFLL